MTPAEKNLISGLFDRLHQASNQPKDAEADQLIRGKVAEIPESPYLMVQSTLVMQQALSNAQSRIAALEKQVAEAKTGAGAQQSGGSFLSGVASFFGGGQSHGQPQRAVPPSPPSAPPPVPMQPAQPSAYASSPQPPPAQGRPGGGFLQGALTTAAGVAGGALLFQGIEGLIGHNPGPFAGTVGPSGGFLGGDRPAENTEITNNYYVEEDPNRGQVDPRDAQADADNPDQSAYMDSASEQDYDPGATSDDYTSNDTDFGGDDGGGGDDSSYV